VHALREGFQGQRLIGLRGDVTRQFEEFVQGLVAWFLHGHYHTPSGGI